MITSFKKIVKTIRDSLNAIKFVNPNDAVEFSFQILENYSEKRPNRVFGSVYAALGQIYHIKGCLVKALIIYD